MKIYETAKIISEFKEPKEGDIGDFSFIACPIEIGEKVHISTHASFVGKGKLKIGNNVTISPHVTIYTSHPEWRYGLNKYCGDHNPVIADVNLEPHCFIGAGAVIQAGITIGRGAIVGAQSFVNTDVEPYTVYIGCPATKIGERK